jgi:hypothetical protein
MEAVGGWAGQLCADGCVCHQLQKAIRGMLDMAVGWLLRQLLVLDSS